MPPVLQVSFEDRGGAQLFVLMSAPLSAHTRGRTQTHSQSAFLSAPLSAVPPNEERTNEGQLGDETVVVAVVVAVVVWWWCGGGVRRRRGVGWL